LLVSKFIPAIFGRAKRRSVFARERRTMKKPIPFRSYLTARATVNATAAAGGWPVLMKGAKGSQVLACR
jgi:hypothetical protein